MDFSALFIYGYTNRRNTLPFVGLVSMTVAVTFVEFGTAAQLVESPLVKLFVWICNRQPR